MKKYKVRVLSAVFALIPFMPIYVFAEESAAASSEVSVSAEVMVGDGPSLIEGAPREGKVVKPSILDPKNSKLFRPKMIWADSWIYLDLPRINDEGKIVEQTDEMPKLTPAERIMQFIKIEEWYNCAPPDLTGKYVLIEFSASWCPACRRAAPTMERWHEKYGKDLVIISVFETDRAQMNNFPAPNQGQNLKHCIGIDTKRRTATAMGVYGIPHSIIVEPKYGAVIWEGMTEQKGYELTDQTIEKILAVGKK